MMDLVDYINELLDIVHYTWFLSYYVRSPRYHLDNENDIMILHKLFVVLVWLVINFLGKGRCEMSIEDLHRDVLELRKLIVEMTTTIATQNSRIAYLQRTLNRQRSYCHREKLQKEVQDTKGSIYSVAKNNPNTIVMTNNGPGDVSSNRGDFQASGRRPSVETPQLPFQSSLVRKGTYKTSLVDVLYTMKNNSSIGTSLGLNFLSSRENVFFSTCIDGKGRPMFRLTIRLIPPFTLQGGCWYPSPLSHHTPHTTPQLSTLICPLTLPTLDRDRFWNSTPWKQTQEMGTTQTRGFLSPQKLAITSSVGRQGSNIMVARAKTMLWSLS